MKREKVIRKCVFFDRDGIVNQSPGPGWVERWEDFHLLPEFVVAARIALEQGYEVAIITNQRGVALGLLSPETLDDMHRRLTDALISRGVPLLGIYMCPHERDTCTCRKPMPGLLLQAAEEHADFAAAYLRDPAAAVAQFAYLFDNDHALTFELVLDNFDARVSFRQPIVQPLLTR